MEIFYDRKYYMSDVYDSIVYFYGPMAVISTADDRDFRMLDGTDAIHFAFGTIQESLSTKNMR